MQLLGPLPLLVGPNSVPLITWRKEIWRSNWLWCYNHISVMLWRIDVDKTHQLEREMWIQQTAALLVNHWHLARATIRACRLQGLFKVLCVFSLFTLIKYTHCKDWLKHVSKALICHFYMTAHEFLCSSFPAPDWMSLLEETFFPFHMCSAGCFLKRDSCKTKLLFSFFKSHC